VPRRTLFLAVLLLALTGCTKLGPGDDHGAKSSTVVYSVTGSGQADVRYAATATEAMTMRQNAELPFSVTVETVDHSQTTYAVTATGASHPTSCSIKVNGVVVNRATAPAGAKLVCSFIK
jgi:hypothetical protein